MQLCYSENAVRKAMSDPQLYNNIMHVLDFRWRNDWLAGLQLFFFFFFLIVEGQNNAECQCEENDRNILIQEPRLEAWKNSYTGITYFKIWGQSVIFFFLFFFNLCLNMLKYSLDKH